MAALTLGTGCDEGVVGHHIGFAPLAVHLAEQLQRQLPAPGLLAGTYQAAVGDHVALAAAAHLHPSQAQLSVPGCSSAGTAADVGGRTVGQLTTCLVFTAQC